MKNATSTRELKNKSVVIQNQKIQCCTRTQMIIKVVFLLLRSNHNKTYEDSADTRKNI